MPREERVFNQKDNEARLAEELAPWSDVVQLAQEALTHFTYASPENHCW